MGDEIACRIRVGRAWAKGKALLETAEILVRGETKLRIPFAEIQKLSTESGVLKIAWKGGDLALELGDRAERWEAKIRSPKSRVEKLGLKPGARVRIVGVRDSGFQKELVAAQATILEGNGTKEHTAIFLKAETKGDLGKVRSLLDALAPDGALWIVRPKGSAAITEGDVLAAGRRAGLVDVKVVAFSETHSALKFVRPVSRR